MVSPPAIRELGDAAHRPLQQYQERYSGHPSIVTSSDLGATFNTRTVNNAVLVGSGETVVVGGLLDKTVTDTADKCRCSIFR